MNPVTTKRSPIVLIRMFVLIELIALLAYLFATIFDEYKLQIYTLLPLSRVFSYEAFKFPFLSVAQFVITVYVFLLWYYDSYTVRLGGISHQWGVFFKKEKTMPLDKTMMATTAASPLGKALHYGSIRIESTASQNLMTLSDISRPQELLRQIERCINPQTKSFNENPNVKNLLAEDEHERLEFKSTLRFDQKSGLVNRELERTAMKTVAAFMNSKGGQLVIGVDDSRKPLGLLTDYKTLYKSSSDGFENHFTQIFNSMIGPESRHLIKLSFHELAGQEVCLIQTIPSPRPVYLKIDDSERFYVRTGNISTPLKLSEIEQYSRSRWPRRVLSV